MTSELRFMSLFAGVGLGLILGGFLAFYGFTMVGPHIWGREFGQIGWLLIFVVPGGAIFGAVVGALMATRRPILFACLFIPPMIFFIVLTAIHVVQDSTHEPQSYVLEITGYE